MKSKDQIVPKEIYVTAKEHIDYSYSDGDWLPVGEYLFAFLHPHEPNKKTDEKRKLTQLQWAYGSYEFKEDVLIQKNMRWVDRQYIVDTSEPAKYQPRIISNEPLTGFEIFEVTTRYSTSNKVFRVKDPRGFVTEITAKSYLGFYLMGLSQTELFKMPVFGKLIRI